MNGYAMTANRESGTTRHISRVKGTILARTGIHRRLSDQAFKQVKR